MGLRLALVLRLAIIICTAFVCFPIVSTQMDWADDDEDPVSTASVEAVLGKTASLPCDIEPEARDDRVYMVLWFRESAGKPLYSYDVRGRPLTKALYWSDTNSFGPRAYFVTVSNPAGLSVDNVQLDDEGVYRCRVDFQNSPTRNHRINLTVIVPPHQILVYDASGRDVAGAVGPLLEGDNLILTCEVRGGRPEPSVAWYNGVMPLSTGTGISMGRHVTVNRLEINHVSRDALNNTYKCQASNTKLVPPAERSVRLEMLLKPLTVNISEKPRQLVSEVEYSLRCDVNGSIPDTEVKWMQNNRLFKRGKINQMTNSSVATSQLTFRPAPEDDGTILKCEGSNPRLPNSALEDSMVMNIMYAPQVNLSLGSTLNPDDIKEGDDVYFECHIKANPKEHRITWSHDGNPVVQNVTWGVIISTRSLVLQHVARYHAGQYTCAAANDRGETQSSPVTLRIHYSPVCSALNAGIVGASLEESVTIPCRVSADPPIVDFEWTFSSSGERFEVPPGHYVTMQDTQSMGHGDSSHTEMDVRNSIETVSELVYTPKNERDYGTLACWGRNSIGKQTEPCIFQVVPAAKPSPLRNCTLRSYLMSSQQQMMSPGNSTTLHGGQNHRESNYINTQYVRDRAAPGGARRTHQSDRFNQKNLTAPRRRDQEGGKRAKLNLPSGSSRADDRRMSKRQSGGGGAANATDEKVRSSGVTSTVSSEPGVQFLKSEARIPVEPGGELTPSMSAFETAPTAMELECVAGYDGGLPQFFILEAYDSRTKKLRLNVSSAFVDIPLFRIDLADLTPSDSAYIDSAPMLHLVAYSVNQKGRSEATVLEDIAINEAEKRTDGSGGLSVLPVAALLTGALFTIGIAVLLVVVLTVRKRREPSTVCDGKEKHLGMDNTVTTPLEMGVGQQRFVVAYTLKQGVEKQPDILSAQKGTSDGGVRDSSLLGSPAAIRPEGLFMKHKESNHLNYISPTYSCQDFEQKPANHQPAGQMESLVSYATLRPSAYGASSSSAMDYTIQQPPLYTAISDSGGGVQYTSSAQNGLLPINGSPGGAAEEPTRPEYLHFERSTLDYQRIYTEAEDADKVANSKALHGAGQDFRHADFTANATELSTSVGNHLGAKMPRVNSSSLPKNRNTRNHIITDTLPGPESCV
ncbi:uncharacterized protein LOC132257796 [Phlebotomus argentipes]|uniref:uncharacterized protein LOC132257796 n=1 Tax=Phlebotomus argentipes TaxID=94469 RepID=UPI002892F177|nr:uncharacterized protein LOC132257796 [Phlebotomus argentipes]